jgi:small redox-active disulfide protein 2
MKITIVGSGCKTCQALEENAKEAAKSLSLDATFDKFTDRLQFADIGVLRTPALMVDGEVLSQGKLLTVNEIESLLVK